MRISVSAYILSFFVIVPNLVWAQDSGKDNRSSYISLAYGYVLPNGVDERNDIFSTWSLRYAMPAGKRGKTSYEFGVTYGDDAEMEWLNGSVSARLDVPVDTIIANALVGLDFTQFTGVGQKDEVIGGHFGGGIMALIGGETYFRFNMKLGTRPGTTLLFDLGLVFMLGQEAAN
jgi:hypothetical protein